MKRLAMLAAARKAHLLTAARRAAGLVTVAISKEAHT
jgi:hypothetical protein